MSDQPTAEDRFRTAEARLFATGCGPAVSRMVRVRDRWTHLLETGAGRPVLLLHGGGSLAASWEPLVGHLADGFHLHAPDRPGCGLTEKLYYRRRMDFREHAVGFVTALLDALGLQRVHLVGSSMGGYWALAFALAHPERVQGLALLGAPAGSARRPSMRERLIAAPLTGSLYATAVRPDRRRLARRMGRGLVAHPDRLREQLLDVMYAGATLPGARVSWHSMVRAVTPLVTTSRLTYALREELPKLRPPALMVWGDRDPCPEHWGRDLCGLMPACRLEVLPGVGHLPWLDEPEATARLLRAFLDESARSPARRPVRP